MRIRNCVLGDAAAIAEIYRFHVETGTASFELEPPTRQQMAERIETLLEASFPYVVGTIDEKVVGYAYAGPYRPRPAYRSTVENSVYLANGIAGRGYGKVLLSSLIEAATQKGFRQMVAIIGDSANAASIALHSSLGFHHTGTLKSVGYKHSRWLDTVIMQRGLGESDRTPQV